MPHICLALVGLLSLVPVLASGQPYPYTVVPVAAFTTTDGSNAGMAGPA